MLTCIYLFFIIGFILESIALLMLAKAFDQFQHTLDVTLFGKTYEVDVKAWDTILITLGVTGIIFLLSAILCFSFYLGV